MSEKQKQERNKFLTELLGECYHVWTEENGLSQKVCKKCNKPNWQFTEGGTIEVLGDNSDFSDWESFGVLKAWIDSQKWGRFFWFEFFGFLDFRYDNKLAPDHAQTTSDNTSPEALADRLYTVLAEGRFWLKPANLYTRKEQTE